MKTDICKRKVGISLPKLTCGLQKNKSWETGWQPIYIIYLYRFPPLMTDEHSAMYQIVWLEIEQGFWMCLPHIQVPTIQQKRLSQRIPGPSTCMVVLPRCLWWRQRLQHGMWGAELLFPGTKIVDPWSTSSTRLFHWYCWRCHQSRASGLILDQCGGCWGLDGGDSGQELDASCRFVAATSAKDRGDGTRHSAEIKGMLAQCRCLDVGSVHSGILMYPGPSFKDG